MQESTLLQDLRYTLTSTTSLYLDPMNHMRQRNASPHRSILDAHIKHVILEWAIGTKSKKEELFSKIVKSSMRVEDVKIMVPDFYTSDRVQFAWLLSSVYCTSFAKIHWDANV